MTISELNVLIASTTPEGMAGAAACYRHAKNKTMWLIFTNSLSSLDTHLWPQDAKIGVIDLQASVDFVRKVRSIGKLLFIAPSGNHSWKKVLAEESQPLSVLWSNAQSENCCDVIAMHLPTADEVTRALLHGENFFRDSFRQAAKSTYYTNDFLSVYVRHLASFDKVYKV